MSEWFEVHAPGNDRVEGFFRVEEDNSPYAYSTEEAAREAAQTYVDEMCDSGQKVEFVIERHVEEVEEVEEVACLSLTPAPMEAPP